MSAADTADTNAGTAERRRLAEADAGTVVWRAWGPYVAERAWGTVREDYSADGDAWRYFPHDHARSRAYRWNEDGMAGVCDEDQTFCLGLALWNGVDPILKERMFGLTGPRGQPRRGRQGVLVVPRLHAHALVDDVALPLPAAALPVRAARRRERRARPRTSPSSNWSTPASSTATGTGSSRSTTPRRARTTCDAVPGGEPRARRRRRCTCCRRCGSATRGPGASRRRRRAGAPPGRGAAGATGLSPSTGAGTARLLADGAPEPLFCDNETNTRAAVGRARRHGVPEGRHRRPRRARRARRSTRRGGARRRRCATC